MDETLYDLQRLSTSELLARYRAVAQETIVTPQHVLDEVARRNVARVNNLLLLFTAVVTLATVVALYVAAARP